LHGSAWQFPNFDNADTFVNRLVRQGLLAHEPIVEAALQEQLNRCCQLPWLHQPRWLDEPAAEYLLKELSVRSVQRRFLRATGLTHKTMFQIERAQYAVTLLQQGVSILDTVEQAGYYDQPHMTRSLKHFIGQTPAEILRADWSA
jgi:methylphosphotriester-DNA--protein-cysteine methyltransferase